MTKNLIIVGAGPGLSNGIAEKFGKERFSIGLISRNAEKLEQTVNNLQLQGIKAFYATANAYQKKELTEAISDLKDEMGMINTLVYNAAALKMKNLLDETTDELADDFRISAAHAFHCVKLLHDDLKQTQGAVLLTGGVFALNPSPQFGSLSLGKASLRNLAFQLHEVLKPDKIYAGTVTIDGYIQPESETHSPRILAEKFWELHQNRDRVEIQY